ncbi:hypothetical protein FBU30_006985 [Linnemannia zychae]|nr:hypothetical protein FBU30_006985 [Linnemannia zychae]
MTKKNFCQAIWGKVVQDTKVFANHVLGKVNPHKPMSSASSIHSYSDSIYGFPLDHSQPHPEQQYPSPQLQQLKQQLQFQLQSSNTIPRQQKQKSTHTQQIYTPYRQVYFSSTLSLNVRTQSSTSLTSDTSTFANDMLPQYESLWEVQLALREIPGMIEGNILVPCENSAEVSMGAKAATNSIGHSVPLSISSSFQSNISLPVHSTQPQQPQQICYDLKEFPQLSFEFEEDASSDESDMDDNDYSNDNNENVEDEDRTFGQVKNFISQPFLQQSLQPHLLHMCCSPYNNSVNSSQALPQSPRNSSSNILIGNKDSSNTTELSGSIEPHLLNRRQLEVDYPPEIAPACTRRQFRGSTPTVTHPSEVSFNTTPGTNAGTGTIMSELRNDRKDSGVFVHDDKDGAIVKITSHSSLSYSSSSDYESEAEHEHKDNCSYQSQNSEHSLSVRDARLGSHWMNNVICIPPDAALPPVIVI